MTHLGEIYELIKEDIGHLPLQITCNWMICRLGTNGSNTSLWLI